MKMITCALCTARDIFLYL